MATSVVIPVRNEEKTIGSIVAAFNNHADTAGRVYVAIDSHTYDDSNRQALLHGARTIQTYKHGKGEVVYEALYKLKSHGHRTERVILCDGDYTGLTEAHIHRMIYKVQGQALVDYGTEMVIGVPDWPNIEVPRHVIDAWARVSGFRGIPWEMFPMDAHGYLLETQLNLRAMREKRMVKYIFMEGLKAPFQWPLSDRRMAALRTDEAWGRRYGVL